MSRGEKIFIILIVLLAMMVVTTVGASDDLEIKAYCWTDKGGNNIPCRIRTKDEKVWLLNRGKWVDDFFVSDTYETDSGDLYLLLLTRSR